MTQPDALCTLTFRMLNKQLWGKSICNMIIKLFCNQMDGADRKPVDVM